MSKHRSGSERVPSRTVVAITRPNAKHAEFAENSWLGGLSDLGVRF